MAVKSDSSRSLAGSVRETLRATARLRSVSTSRRQGRREGALLGEAILTEETTGVPRVGIERTAESVRSARSRGEGGEGLTRVGEHAENGIRTEALEKILELNRR